MGVASLARKVHKFYVSGKIGERHCKTAQEYQPGFIVAI